MQISLNLINKKMFAIFEAIFSAAQINLDMARAKSAGRSTLAVQIGSETQLMHLESVLKSLFARTLSDRLDFWILTKATEIKAVRKRVLHWPCQVKIGLERSSRFLLACDFMLAVDQGSVFPYFGCATRACSFHGQPSKGNVFQRFNYRQINTLFVYGPLMRDHYLHTKASHPEWPDVTLLEVGQPLSDRQLNSRVNTQSAREQIGLDPGRQTVIYAPSFEYCSSLATDGQQIIECLLAENINLIVKPHPAFYNTAKFEDEFNGVIPHVADWQDVICRWTNSGRCVFSVDNTLSTELALAAADVMLTDYSGIAFDGIALDLGMIYWDCPKFWNEYMPRRYGIDGKSIRKNLASNVGRDCGISVANNAELSSAVAAYLANPRLLADQRQMVRQQLFFNEGHATEAMVDAVEQLIQRTQRS